jgi:hypothetical protein
MESINVTVHSTNLTELKAKVENAFTVLAASGFKGSYTANLNVHPVYPTALAIDGLERREEVKVEEIKEEVKTEKKRGRVKEEVKVEEVKEEVKVETVEEVKEETKTYTKEEIATALQNVSETVNFQKAKEILTSFKKEDGSQCKKISDVLGKDYASFMAKCEEAKG